MAANRRDNDCVGHVGINTWPLNECDRTISLTMSHLQQMTVPVFSATGTVLQYFDRKCNAINNLASVGLCNVAVVAGLLI